MALGRSPRSTWACLGRRVRQRLGVPDQSLNETVVQFYTPRPRPTGELNPRLGCWGPRPDLIEQGHAESDCAIAAVLGLSIWVPGASPPVDDTVFLEALRDTVIECLSYWVVVAKKATEPAHPSELSSVLVRVRAEPRDVGADDQRVDLVRPLVGEHRLQVDHVSKDRMLQADAIGAQHAAHLPRDLERHRHVRALPQADLGRP